MTRPGHTHILANNPDSVRKFPRHEKTPSSSTTLEDEGADSLQVLDRAHLSQSRLFRGV